MGVLSILQQHKTDVMRQKDDSEAILTSTFMPHKARILQEMPFSAAKELVCQAVSV